MVTATIFTLFNATTTVAAFGRQNKRRRAALGRATSFVASFVLPLNRVNVVAVITILVLHVGVIGHYVPRQSCLMFPHRTINAGKLRHPQGNREVLGPVRPSNSKKKADYVSGL